ncbi:MAG TPA: hypothetical protein VN513_09865 [Gemmatimonadales bacterium]|nr:hypothetical protein [Gemmatimonadales bacterium]
MSAIVFDCPTCGDQAAYNDDAEGQSCRSCGAYNIVDVKAYDATREVRCPRCHGDGTVGVVVPMRAPIGARPKDVAVDCDLCGGDGVILIAQAGAA